MNIRKISLMAAAMAVMSMPAWAIDLHDARASGQIGEKADGYVSALKPSAEVNALVAEVNARRKQEYARISKENGQSADIVGKLAAQQIAGTLEPGASYQAADGSWKKR